MRWLKSPPKYVPDTVLCSLTEACAPPTPQAVEDLAAKAELVGGIVERVESKADAAPAAPVQTTYLKP